MSAELVRLFPDGLKASDCERFKPRQPPAIPFLSKTLPSSVEVGDDTKTKTITVELNAKTTTKVEPYVFRDVESFLAYQAEHDYILAQQGARVNWDKLEKLRVQTLRKASAISANTINKEEKAARKKHVELLDSVVLRQDAIIKKAFTLYQQMSGTALRAEWDDLVTETCFTIVPPATQQRGQDWDALVECKRLHLLTVCDEDAAERQHLYRDVCLKRDPKIKIKTFWQRMKEMDKKTPLLPCLKDKVGCPPEVERANVCMTSFEMCRFLMRNVTVRMEDEYNCLHNNVPTDPKTLVEQLTKIETKLSSVRGNDKVKADDRRKAGPPDNHSRSSKKRAKADAGGRMKTGDPIPRKNFEKPSKNCTLCVQYGGFHKTHKTDACKKWVAGGNHHPEWKGARAANINAHSSDDVKQLMAQQAKSMEKLQYKIAKLSEKKKSRKAAKRSRSRYSDSDSSDSD
jgi:hypothetical protein